MNNKKQNISGRVPPQSLDLEMAVLGACMLEKGAVIKVVAILEADDFYSDAHKRIFKTIVKLFDRGSPVDLLTITDTLRKSDELESVGGAYGLTMLTSNISSSANCEYHAHIVKEKSIARKIISLCTESVLKAYDDTTDIFDLVSDHSRKLYSDVVKIQGIMDVTPQTRIMSTVKEIVAAMSIDDGITGVPTRLRDVDRLTGGWQNGNLIVLAGRAGMGKTATLLEFAHGASDAGYSAGIFQLEMSDIESGMREISMKSKIPYQDLRRGKITPEQFKKMADGDANELLNSKVYIDTIPHLSTTILRAKAYKMINEYGVKILFIDNLNLMDGTKYEKNTEEKISNISRECKLIAKEANIPVILLAQLNREVEKEKDKRPKLHHLRSSGSIEQNADIVIMLYRPEYYDKEPVDDEGYSTKNTLYCFFEKNRQGATGEVKLYIDIANNFIDDLDKYRGDNVPFPIDSPARDITSSQHEIDLPF